MKKNILTKIDKFKKEELEQVKEDKGMKNILSLLDKSESDS
jgi:hypothetical protein